MLHEDTMQLNHNQSTVNNQQSKLDKFSIKPAKARAMSSERPHASIQNIFTFKVFFSPTYSTQS